jgi:type VI secretion system protein ImpA
MASPPVLDFAALLAPIGGNTPAGVDWRGAPSPNSIYYAIKDARSAARAAERQLAMGDDDEGVKPDWKPVLLHGTKAIAMRSKDLELVAYMIEALARLHGFAGVRDGFRLARELIEKYWDHLYPLPDEEGLETRVGPLTGLNGDDAEGTLIAPLTRIPLTEGRDAGPFAFFHYQAVNALRQIQDEEIRDKKIRAGALAPAAFDTAVRETSGPFVVNLVEDISAAGEEFARLDAVLQEKCGAKAPPTSAIRTALVNCLDAVKFFGRDKLAAQAAAPAPPGNAPTASAPAPALEAVATAVGDIRTRDDALQALLKVAEFFRRNEPHTPVSYSIEQAVRWGRMSLPELLRELIPDESSKQQLFKQVGIREESSS